MSIDNPHVNDHNVIEKHRQNAKKGKYGSRVKKINAAREKRENEINKLLNQ